MNPNTSGRRPRSLVALLLALLTTLMIWQPAAASASEIAPNLVSLERVSGDVVTHGDDVVLAWEFDAPIESLTVTLRDAIGGLQYLHGGWSGGTSGEARATVDTSTWPRGPMTVSSVSYWWSSSDGTSHWVDLDARGDVTWASEGLDPIPSASAAMRVAPFEVSSDVDLSVPPILVSAVRTSDDTVGDGDIVRIEWAFDRPVDSVAFTLTDSLGRYHQAQWSSWWSGTGPEAAGVATATIGTDAWGGGDVVFAGLDYAWYGGSMSVDAVGSVVWKYPEGLADPQLPEGGLAHLGFAVSSDQGQPTAPRLTSLTRVSPDIVHDGDEITLDWNFEGVVDSMAVVLVDSLGGTHYAQSDMWGPSASGQARAYVDTTSWPDGAINLERIEYSWAAGGGIVASVALDANGEVLWSSGTTGEVPSGAGAVSFTPFEVEADVDLSVPVTLTGLERASGDVLTEGEELQVAWSSDRPLDSVRVMLRDSRGERHTADWSVWEQWSPAATSGVARAVVDTTRWAAGPVAFDGVEYSWGTSTVVFDAAGAIVSKSPESLQDTSLPLGDLPQLGFTVESDIDLDAVPSLGSVSRLSTDVLAEGEDAAIAWEFDAPVQWVSFLYLDGLGREQSVMWTGEATTSGVASVLFGGGAWAPGDAELIEVRYSAPGDNSVVLARDGSVIGKWPSGIDDPAPYALGFAALDFTVETDAAFQTVEVPAPVFTDATCDAPARLVLADFPHGGWSWGPTGGGSGGGGQSYDGVPSGLEGGGSFTVTAWFDDGWGTTGESRWTHDYAALDSCEPLLSFTVTPTPTIEGDPLVGSTLTAVPGAWEPAPDEVTFRWLRDGVPIEHATEPRYAPGAADVGAEVAVEVTGSKAGYQATSSMSAPVSVAEPGPAVTRIAGAGRSGPAVAASAHRWGSGVEAAYVVNGSDQLSSVLGATLAGAADSPVLPVKSESIPAEVAAELDRLDPARIVVIGDEALVSAAVAGALDGFAVDGVDRLSGEGPFGLAAAVSAQRWTEPVGTAYVVNTADPGAAFAAAALAGAADAPLVAVEAAAVPDESAAELERLAPERIVVLGGADSVSEAVVAELAGLSGAEVDRVATGGRFQAAAAVSAAGWPSGADVVYVVNPADRPAHAAAAALAGAAGAPLLSVKTSSVPGGTADEIRRLDPRRIVVLGDDGAVDGTVVAELGALID